MQSQPYPKLFVIVLLAASILATPALATSAVTHGQFRIRSQASQLELDGTQTRNVIQQRQSDRNTYQHWTLHPRPGHRLQVVNTHSGLCLDAGADAKRDGSPVGQSACANTLTQTWRLQTGPTLGTFSVINEQTGKCLDVWGNHNEPGALLANSGCWGGTNQLFEFLPLQEHLVTPPLQTNGPWIVDAQQHTTRLSAVNWYGANDTRFVVGGLSQQPRDAIAKTIARMGFNAVRLPFSNEMLRRNPLVAADDLRANPDLVGLGAVQVFLAVTAALNEQGLAVILNNHSTEAQWCCHDDPCNNFWFNTGVRGCRHPQSEAMWIEDWETMARLTRNLPYVVGVDLRNEPRGPVKWDLWASAAERAARRLHAINPNLLIVVEGLAYASDLAGVRHRPVRLQRPNKVVYSSHTYPWFGNAGNQSYTDYAASMDRAWGYIVQGDDAHAAPVWVSELGAPQEGVNPPWQDRNHWHNAMRYLQARHLGFAYWALNTQTTDGRAESYSLLESDWSQPNTDYRHTAMHRLMLAP